MPTKATDKKKSRIQILSEQLAIAKEMDRRNKNFAKLPQAAKRVAVAEDVIKQLDAKFLFARQRVYIERRDGHNDFEKDTAIIDAVSAAPCNVCAKGAVFVSMVGITNGVTFGDVLVNGEGATLSEISSAEITNYVDDVFPENMLHLMESIFEEQSCATYLHAYLGDKAYAKLVPEGDESSVDVYVRRKLSGAEQRLRWVMRNIIANGGELKLTRRDLEVV